MRKSHEKIGRSIESRIHDMTGALLVNGSMNAAVLNKAYRGTKKQELWDNYLAIVAAVESLENTVEDYIAEEVELRCKSALNEAEKYKKMYEREHKEVMAMKDEVRKVKDERRRESPGRPAKYGDSDYRLILADRAAGLSLKAIANKRGMAINTVRKLLANHNINNDTNDNESNSSKNELVQTNIDDFINE